MASSYNDNVNNDILIDLDDEPDEQEVSYRKRKKPSTTQKKARPPQTPKVASFTGNSSKTRKNQSPFWVHFIRNPTDRELANCIYCKDEINCKGVNGTSTLSNHVKRCMQFPANLDVKQKLLNFDSKTIVNEDGTSETLSAPPLWNFSKERMRKVLAKMIIVDELPFMFVEKEGFNEFVKELNPLFILPSRFNAARDCYTLFIEERRKLYNFLGKLSSRVCLTTDCWTSGQNLGYMCLTAHFIDSGWTLHKRIINFCLIPGHTGKVIGQTVEKCLSEWNLTNILTVTVDNASSNDLAIDYLRRKFNNSECDVMEGKYLHMRCAAHILNLVVRDGLLDLEKPVHKIRALVRHVRSSPARKKRFEACVAEEKIESKSGLCLDVETRWNSTYLMLESALKFKKAFGCLLVKDSILQKEMRKYGENITNDDWKEVSYLLPFLKIFYDATLKMSATRYVTSNSYVEVIFGVGEVLNQHLKHPDEGIKKMASQMKKKYDKYWGKIENLNLLLFVSLVLDPRFKLVYVEWMVKAAYGGEKGDLLGLNIRYFVRSFFEFYTSSTPFSKGGPSSSSTSTTSSNLPPKEKKQDDMFNFSALLSKKFEMEMGEGEGDRKTELEKYLEDARESMESSFNILQWWKENQKRYPILSMMARDVLAIPVSTVASESAFSTGGRVLDSFRTSLSPIMVEALICGQDWLRTSRTPLIIEESLLEMAKIEEGMEDLQLEQPEIVIEETDA